MSRTIGLKGLCHAICHLFKNFKAKTFLASIEFQTVSCRLLLRMARMDMVNLITESPHNVCVTDCYFLVNVLDLPFASPITI